MGIIAFPVILVTLILTSYSLVLFLARRKENKFRRVNVTLAVEYDHSATLCSTWHIIAIKIEGPNWRRCAKEIMKSTHAKHMMLGQCGALRDGPYLSICVGIRNATRILTKVGVPVGLIWFNNRQVVDLLRKHWPEEWL